MTLLRALLFASPALVTTYMGFWQLSRRGEKARLLEDRREALEATASKPLQPDCLEKINVHGMDGYAVEVTGQLDLSKEILVGPRIAPQWYQKKFPHTSAGSGYYVVYPMEVFGAAGKKWSVLLNNGWIPREDVHRPEERMSRQWSIPLTMKAVIVDSENAEGDPFVRSNESVALDANAIGRKVEMERAGEMKILLERIEPESVSGKPIGKTVDDYITHRIMPWQHSTYAVTWFGMTAVILGVAFARFRKPSALSAVRGKRA